MDDTQLEIAFIPSLLEILLLSEREKGSPLTEQEVLNIRDNAVCITLRRTAVESLEESRGFKDLNPDQCWQEWCVYKESQKAN